MAGEDARDLAEFVRTRSAEAFERVAGRYAGLVHAACLRRLGRSADAEDASQAVFLALARKVRSVRAERLGSWLHGAAARASAFVLRSRARRARHEEEAGRMRALGTESPGSDWSAARPHLDAELGALPAKLREAVARRYLAGQTRAEIARELGVAEGTVASRCAAGVERLRRRLAKRGALLSAGALVPLLLAEAKAAAPAALLASLPTLASGAAATGAAAGVSASAGLIAKGVIKAMFWTKVRLCAAALAAAAVVGTGTGAGVGVALSAASAGEAPGNMRQEKDFAGREWTLTDWQEGSRPYKKNLAEREAEYRKKWGEDWAGVQWPQGGKEKIWLGGGIGTPGKWDYEEIVVISDAKRASPNYAKIPSGHDHRSLGAQVLTFSPGGGEVTDIYAMCLLGAYHVDAKTKAITYIGDKSLLDDVKRMPAELAHPKFKGRGDFFIRIEKTIPPARDGLDEKTRLVAYSRAYIPTVEPVTGRVFFVEPMGKPAVGVMDPKNEWMISSSWMKGAKLVGTKLKSPYALRYIEKLLPYKVGGREMLLPAILDYNELHKQVGAEPVMKDGKRAPPRFAVRTTVVEGLPAVFADCGMWGRRVTFSMDGKAVYVGGKNGIPEAVEIATGKKLGAIPVKGNQSLPWVGAKNIHGGSCSRFDAWFYNCTGQGSGASPGLLFRVNVKDGKAETLYDTLHPPAAKVVNRKPKGRNWDGPGDALSLTFSSTRYQTQCPRTGAVYNSGWDNSGLRRYHGGFVTTLAAAYCGRPEWKGKSEPVGDFCHKSTPDIAPDGDLYMECVLYPGDGLTGRFWPKWRPDPARKKLLIDGLRVVRIYRTDWPKEQPVNGYANKFLSPEKREALMLEYAKRYIANYGELSKIY